jgi:hypothetical protein
MSKRCTPEKRGIGSTALTFRNLPNVLILRVMVAGAFAFAGLGQGRFMATRTLVACRGACSAKCCYAGRGSVIARRSIRSSKPSETRAHDRYNSGSHGAAPRNAAAKRGLAQQRSPGARAQLERRCPARRAPHNASGSDWYEIPIIRSHALPGSTLQAVAYANTVRRNARP